MHGFRPLVGALAALSLLPRWFGACVPYLDIVMMYLIVVAAALAWMELSRGVIRLFLQAMIFAGLAIALARVFPSLSLPVQSTN